jgi:UDP-glucose 4-epimerase
MTDAVLIVGGAGFIGRHLAESIAATGRPVIAATRRPATFRHAAIQNSVATFECANDFLPLLTRSASVIHAASTSTPGSSAAQPQLDGNLRTTLALIEALQTQPKQRLVYLSSGGTLYGDRERSARENDPLRPHSYHGAGKAAAEHFVHAWAIQFDGTAVVLRPSNVYGPGQLPQEGFGIIPAAFEAVRTGQPLTVWGDGSTIRDYLYVDDLVSLCERVLHHALPTGMHTYNAAHGDGISLGMLFNAIDAITGQPLRFVHQAPRRVDVHRIVPDSGAARHTFGWQPVITLEQGLRQTWEWFQSLQ